MTVRLVDPRILVGGRVVEADEDRIVVEKAGERYIVEPGCEVVYCYDERYEEQSVECDTDAYLVAYRDEKEPREERGIPQATVAGG